MNNEYNHDDFMDSLESKARRNVNDEVIDLGNNTIAYITVLPDDMPAEVYNEIMSHYDFYDASFIGMEIYYCGIVVGYNSVGGIITRQDYIFNRDRMIEEITSDSLKEMIADTVKYYQETIKRLTA